MTTMADWQEVAQRNRPPLLVRYQDPKWGATHPLVHGRTGDAGYDLYAYLPDGPFPIDVHHQAEVPAGIEVKIPAGYYGRIVARSSTGRDGFELLEAVIDSGYTGRLFCRVWYPALIPMRPPPRDPWYSYHGGGVNFHRRYIHPNVRYGQLIIQSYLSPEIQVVTKLPPTERGAQGFGSTGR